MKARLFTVITLFSTLLLIAIMVMWYRSRLPSQFGIGDEFYLNSPDSPMLWSAQSRIGILVVSCSHGDWGLDQGTNIPVIEFPGFRYDGSRGPKGGFYFYTTSHRALAILFSIIPSFWLYSYLRKRSKHRRDSGFQVEPKSDAS